MTPATANLRPELAQRLRQRLEAFQEGFRHNLALIGPSGSGKTFQLRLLLASPPPRLLCIYCPLYRESCRSFLRRLLCAVLQAGLPPPPETPAGIAQEPLEGLLQRADHHLPKTAAAMRLVDQLIARRLYGEAFNRALDTIPVLSQERGMPCVFMLDEFLFLEELGLGHAFHELGKRVMTWTSTLFILSSSACFRARLILRERLQLLFGQFELLTLDAVDAAEAEGWMRQELRRVRGAREMTPFLLRWLGGYPWYLSVFLKRLRELATLRKGAGETEPLFLHAAWDVLGAADGPLHQWCGSRMDALARSRAGSRAMEALWQVAEGARTTTAIGARIGRAGLSESLQLLIEQDLAQRNGMCWAIPDPILRCWLSTVCLTQRTDAPLDGSGGDARARVESYLRGLWTHWVQAHRLSFPEQVVNLFTKFADDTVSLDSKTGRLPKFETIKTQAQDAAGADAYLIADGQGKRWCASIQTGQADERAITRFDAFCRAQLPKPSRKVLIVQARMDQTMRLLAKAANMWVWEPGDLHALMELYGQL